MQKIEISTIFLLQFLLCKFIEKKSELISMKIYKKISDW